MTLYLHVTGFGPFCGVAENPTMRLLDRFRMPAFRARLSAARCVLLSSSVIVVSGNAFYAH
jgi:hypothetical protein